MFTLTTRGTEKNVAGIETENQKQRSASHDLNMVNNLLQYVTF